MANDLIVTFVGNVTQDPELRFTAGGKAVCNFNLAVSNSWKPEGETEWKEETTFFRVSVWDQQAENVAEGIPKGARVAVKGTLMNRSWEKEDGTTGYSLEIRATEVFVSVLRAKVEITKIERTKAPTATQAKKAAAKAKAEPEPDDDAPY